MELETSLASGGLFQPWVLKLGAGVLQGVRRWGCMGTVGIFPNIVLQVAQTSYRWGSRAVGECSCCLLMQLEEQPPEETVHAWR